MGTNARSEDQLPPRGRLRKEAATGEEREEALRNIRTLSRVAGDRAKALGLTEADIQKMMNEP
jgi:hypothetical protein